MARKRRELTDLQKTVLEAIREHPRTRRDLTDDLGLHPQTLHHIVKVLKKRKLVKTVIDPTLMDLRKRIYMVTETEYDELEGHECPLCGSTKTKDDPELYGYWVCLDCRARFEPPEP